MNKYSFLSFLAVFAVSISSCSDITPEIVEQGQDPLPEKPKGIDRSKIELPPVDLMTQYLFFKDNDQERVVTVSKEDQVETVADIEDVTITIATSIPVEKDFTAEVEVMTAENAPKTYPDVVQHGARKVLPQDVYTLSGKSVAFKVGEQEKTLTLSLNQEAVKGLTDGETYVLPLILKISDDLKESVNLHNFFLVKVVKQTFLALPEGDNIQVSGEVPSGLDEVDTGEITLSTNVSASGLYKLIDGDKIHTYNYWKVSSPLTRLDINLSNRKKLKTVALWTLKYNKGDATDMSIRKVKVYAFDKVRDRYVLQGEVNLDKGQEIVAITFKQPIETDSIRLTEFVGDKYDNNPDGTIYLHELAVYSTK